MILTSAVTTNATAATVATATPDLYQTNPALTAALPAIGQRAPQRQRLYAAAVTTPLAATIPAQDALWRATAIRLAYEHDATCAASWLGHSARGTDSYAVRPSRRSHHGAAVRVSFIARPDAVTVEDGRWLCECRAGRAGQPCVHVGAAALLANRRAIVRESVELAQMERLGWAHATRHGGNVSEQVAFWYVGSAYGSRWDHLRVVWDTANHVAVWCDCGASGPCAHIGAVAQRMAMEHAGAIRAAQDERYARA